MVSGTNRDALGFAVELRKTAKRPEGDSLHPDSVALRNDGVPELIGGSADLTHVRYSHTPAMTTTDDTPSAGVRPGQRTSFTP